MKYEIVEAEGSHYGEDWNYYGGLYSPGVDWEDIAAEWVRRVVGASAGRGSLDYGDFTEENW